MSDLSSVEILFSGSESVSEFIRRVKRHAFESGRQRDMEWMADYASLCFADEALRWFAKLDPEVAGDWGRLQRALLEDYSDEGKETSSTNIPAPAPAPAAAPPPTASQLVQGLSTLKISDMKGRIRATDGNSRNGYVSSRVDDRTGVFRWTATADQSLIVSYSPKHHPDHLLLEPKQGKNRYLAGAHLYAGEGHTDFRDKGTAYLSLCGTPSSQSSSSNTLKRDPSLKAPGLTYAYIWNVLSDGTLIASVQENGYTHMLTPVMSTNSKNIYLAVNYDAFVRWSPHSNFVKLILILEPTP